MITIAMTCYKWTRYTDNTIKSILNNKKNKIDFIILLDNPGENEKTKLKEFEKNWNNENWTFRYWIQETKDRINGLWNHLKEMETQETVLVINDDIEISENFDELIENEIEWKILNPMFFTPYHWERLFKPDCIAWHCRAIQKKELVKILPIDNKIKLYFGDDWIFHRGKEEGLQITWMQNVQVLHYTSKTCENPEIIEEVRKQIEQDSIEFTKIVKEHGRPDRRFNPIE